MDSQQESSASCPVCGETKNIKMCSRCRLVGYCSVSHQKEHWTTHKTVCKFPVPPSAPFKIQDEPEAISGRVAIATKDFFQGAAILDEVPIFHYNLAKSFVAGKRKKDGKEGKEEEEEEEAFPESCVTCGSEIVYMKKKDRGADEEGNAEKDKDENEKKSYTKCSKCFWPMCSIECEKASIHADNECAIFAQSRAFYLVEKDRREHTLATRASSIYKKNPLQWARILQCAPLNTIKSQEEVLAADAAVKQKQHQEIIPLDSDENDKNELGPRTKVSEPKVEQIQAQASAISRLVGYSFPMDPQYEPEMEHCCLYPTASHFENACRANCVWNIGPPPEFRIRIRAAIPIKKGERLTVDRHAHLNSYSGTRERQELYWRRFKRSCHCAMCKDPTEFGSFQSGIACKKCREEKEENEEQKENNNNNNSKNKKKTLGYLLPIDPLDKEDTALWKCSSCDHTEPASAFQEELAKAYDPFDNAAKINMKKAFIRWEVDKALATQKVKFLHPNHWVFQKGIRTDQAINGVPRWEKGEFEAYIPDLKRIIDHHNIVLGVLDKTHPGLHEERVRILVLLGDLLLWLCDNTCERADFHNITRDEAVELDGLLSLILKHWGEASVYWDKTPTLVTTPHAIAGRVEDEDPPNMVDRVNAAKKLQEHVNAKMVEFRKAADLAEENAEIKEWAFSYRKNKV